MKLILVISFHKSIMFEIMRVLLLLLSIITAVIFSDFATQSEFFRPPPFVCPSCFHPPTINQSVDYGGIIYNDPIALFNPRNPHDISDLLKAIYDNPKYHGITVGPNGARHSTNGQAQVPGGVVVDMRSLPRSFKVDPMKQYVDVDGGALWVELLEETLKYGLTPRSWADYLYLTIGGTLSLGGVSGQTFRYGPQISEVLEMDVVTGKGEMITCSEELNPDLFFGVLGGMGQFGIITRARIIVEAAPQRVKWINIPYSDFNKFIEDQELLITMKEPDYVEGYLIEGNPPTYLIELGLYYSEGDPIEEQHGVLSRLSSDPGTDGVTDVTYFDFLNRVRQKEICLRTRGEWHVPHPWFHLLVPKSEMEQLNQHFLRAVEDTPVSGPILIYPVFTNKWNSNTSLIFPQEEPVMYVTGTLRSAPANCTPESDCMNHIFQLNQKMIDEMMLGIGENSSKASKFYLAYWSNEREWSVHFGEKKWEELKKLKNKVDPLRLLAPGQLIFQREVEKKKKSIKTIVMEGLKEKYRAYVM